MISKKLVGERLLETMPEPPYGLHKEICVALMLEVISNNEKGFLEGETVMISRPTGLAFFPKEMSVKDLFTNL